MYFKKVQVDTVFVQCAIPLPTSWGSREVSVNTWATVAITELSITHTHQGQRLSV